MPRGSRVFISYRRAEGEGIVHRMRAHMEKDLGSSAVFMDKQAIMPGDDFRTRILRELESCSAMLVLIGPAWADERPGGGLSRLHEPADLVRLEIETALSRGIRVIPVLLDPVSFPPVSALPAPLHPLRQFQHQVLHQNEYFEFDMARIISAVRADRPKRLVLASKWALGAAALAAAAVFLGWLVTRHPVQEPVPALGEQQALQATIDTLVDSLGKSPPTSARDTVAEKQVLTDSITRTSAPEVPKPPSGLPAAVTWADLKYLSGLDLKEAAMSMHVSGFVLDTTRKFWPCEGETYVLRQPRLGTKDILDVLVCTRSSSASYHTTSEAAYQEVKRMAIKDGYKYVGPDEDDPELYEYSDGEHEMRAWRYKQKGATYFAISHFRKGKVPGLSD